MFRLANLRRFRFSPLIRAFADYPDHEKLNMPLLSPTMTTGTIVKWLAKEGETVKAGKTMFEVETDKSTLGYEVQQDIVLAKILMEEGSQSPVGSPIAILVDDEQSVSAFAGYKLEVQSTAEPKSESPSPKEASISAPAKKIDSAPRKSSDRVFISPLALSLSKEHNIDISTLSGSGPGGRIIREDILDAISSPKTPERATPTKPYHDVLHSSIRKVIAARLLESKQTIPHYYVSMECNMDKLENFRKGLNEISGTKISVNSIVIKAAALACLQVPECNSSWGDNEIRTFDYVDMSVAVQTDRGLITPIVKDAHQLRLGEIASEMKTLADAAKEGTLKPEQFQGGTFTISNLGMFGVKHFSAIINPPQSCILAVGGSVKKVVKDEDGFKETSTMTVTLSADHRAVDGAVGARWLQAFKGYIEEPLSMLV